MDTQHSAKPRVHPPVRLPCSSITEFVSDNRDDHKHIYTRTASMSPLHSSTSITTTNCFTLL
eukprot:17162-Heterococcus_DN1.PRE.1